MDLRRLRTFVTIAEQGTVSRAALRLRISQPGLSRQIGELQQELGLKLFDRVGRRLVLTAEGEQLLADCRRLLAHADAITERVDVLRGGDTGVLKVAASPLQIESVFSTFLHQYSKRYPNVRLKLIEAAGLDTLAMLERGEIHFGVCLLQSVRNDDSNFGLSAMPPIELFAVFHPSLRVECGSTIDVTRLAAYPLLLPDASFAVRRMFDAVCSLARLKPDVLMESRAPHTLLAFAEARHGVAIIPSGLRTHRYTLRTVRVLYKGAPLREPLAVVWNTRRVLPRYASDFSELLAAHMRKLYPTLASRTNSKGARHRSAESK
jgi:DNA-binding transcriptional LysR family regulator